MSVDTSADDTSVDAPPELQGEIVGSGPTEEVIRRYVRSPEDVLRLVVFAAVTLTLLALAARVEDSIVGLERDIIELFGFITPAIERVLHGTVEVIIVVATLLVRLVPLVTKRYRPFGYIISASLLASVLMSAANWFVDREVSSVAVNELAERAGITTDVGSGIGRRTRLDPVLRDARGRHRPLRQGPRRAAASRRPPVPLLPHAAVQGRR